MRQLQHFIYTKRLGGPILQTFSSKLYFQLSILRHKRGECVVKQCSGLASFSFSGYCTPSYQELGLFDIFAQKSYFFTQEDFFSLVSTLVGLKWGAACLDRLLFARAVLEAVGDDLPPAPADGKICHCAAARVPPNYSPLPPAYSAA